MSASRSKGRRPTGRGAKNPRREDRATERKAGAHSTRNPAPPSDKAALTLTGLLKRIQAKGSTKNRSYAKKALAPHLRTLVRRHDAALYEAMALVYAVGFGSAHSAPRRAMMAGLGVPANAPKPFLAILKASWPPPEGKGGKLHHNRLSAYARALTAAEKKGVAPRRVEAEIRKAGGFEAYARLAKPQRKATIKGAAKSSATARPPGDESHSVTSPQKKRSERDGRTKKKIKVEDSAFTASMSDLVEHKLLQRKGGYAVALLKVVGLRKHIRVVVVAPTGLMRKKRRRPRSS